MRVFSARYAHQMFVCVAMASLATASLSAHGFWLAVERGSRWNRWLYHGFHSLAFPFMYYKRPPWDIIIIVLSLGGIAISVTSGLPAWRRLVRHTRRARRSSKEGCGGSSA
jgi:hypothetical protein